MFRKKRVCKESLSGFVIPPPKNNDGEGERQDWESWWESRDLHSCHFRIKDFARSLTE